MAEWTVCVRNDSWNYSALKGSFGAVLKISDLAKRLQTEIKNRADVLAEHPFLDSGSSQISVELARLHAFEGRLAAIKGPERLIKIGACEVPISFNRELFTGTFLSVHCWLCQRISAPEETWIVRFEEEDGMQYYGELRTCMCGNSIAYNFDGHRRP